MGLRLTAKFMGSYRAFVNATNLLPKSGCGPLANAAKEPTVQYEPPLAFLIVEGCLRAFLHWKTAVLHRHS
jgi:hypothetical protein